jgi:serine protease Do
LTSLDLPKGQGLVVEDPGTDTPASKAGLRKHDILLELAGQPVPSDPAGLAKLEATIKANTPVEIAVLRRGVKQTIRGLTLPESAHAAKPPARTVNRDF